MTLSASLAKKQYEYVPIFSDNFFDKRSPNKVPNFNVPPSAVSPDYLSLTWRAAGTL